MELIMRIRNKRLTTPTLKTGITLENARHIIQSYLYVENIEDISLKTM